MSTKKYLVTKEGLEKLKTDLAEKKKKLVETKEILSQTIEAGDLSENDAYTIALEDSLTLEGEIFKLTDMIEKHKIVKNESKGKVEIGDKVKIKDVNGKEMIISIVGENEANPLESKVSHNSPLGKAILGKKKGEDFEFRNPKGVVQYTLVEIIN